MLSAYYNVGSTALVLLLIALAIAGFFYYRSRRYRAKAGGGGALSLGPDYARDEENIPLTREGVNESTVGLGSADDYRPVGVNDGGAKGKGREKDVDPNSPRGEAIFDVGGSDDEDEEDDRQRRR